MTNLHPAIDCVIFKKNLVNVKMNLNYVKKFSINGLEPLIVSPVPHNNLLNVVLKVDGQILVIEDNRKVLISFENQRTNQHNM